MSYKFNAGEVYKIAIQIEENGKKFYDESQKSIDIPEIRTLFAELAGQEIEHKKRFESLRAQLPAESTGATVWDPENELDLYIKMMADQHIFVSSAGLKEQIAGIKGTADALRIAIDFEKDSVLFFLSLEEAVEGKKDQDLIKILVKEEQVHLKRLTLQLAKLSK